MICHALCTRLHLLALLVELLLVAEGTSQAQRGKG
jgi:hypothetical protein